nr:cytochrome b/b6 domain-containing protein [Halomonas elongata]
MSTTSKAPIVIKRHALFTRLWHWVNAICLVVLLMSGLQIFNAHPALYWGKDSHFDTPALSIGAIRTAEGELRGITRLGGYRFDTTGVLGVSGPRDDREIRAFPPGRPCLDHAGSPWAVNGTSWPPGSSRPCSSATWPIW